MRRVGKKSPTSSKRFVQFERERERIVRERSAKAGVVYARHTRVVVYTPYASSQQKRALFTYDIHTHTHVVVYAFVSQTTTPTKEKKKKKKKKKKNVDIVVLLYLSETGRCRPRSEGVAVVLLLLLLGT